MDRQGGQAAFFLRDGLAVCAIWPAQYGQFLPAPQIGLIRAVAADQLAASNSPTAFAQRCILATSRSAEHGGAFPTHCPICLVNQCDRSSAIRLFMCPSRQKTREELMKQVLVPIGYGTGFSSNCLPQFGYCKRSRQSVHVPERPLCGAITNVRFGSTKTKRRALYPRKLGAELFVQ